MSLANLYNRIVLLSPYIEVCFRNLYWKNISLLRKYKPKSSIIPGLKGNSPVKFELIVDYLRSKGIKKGSLLILHSSYGALESTGLSPDGIIDALLELLGEEGTLAMPVIRKYKEEPKEERILTTDLTDVVSTYDVEESKITTGLLPYFLMKRKGSYTSRFPLNPMTAYGPLAKQMMEHNLDGAYPTPHGENSSWKFCYDHDAVVIGLGVDLAHYLTITHVAEEAFPGWPVVDWYRERKFKIKDRDFETDVTIRERKPEWGMLYFTERNYKNDLLKKRILINKNISGIEVGIVHAKLLIGFLNDKKNIAYPYCVKKSLLKIHEK